MFIVIMYMIPFILSSVFIWAIAKKTGHGDDAWMAWIPVCSQILLLNIVRMPIALVALYWLMFIPVPLPGFQVAAWLISIGVRVVVWKEIAVVRNKKIYLGVLAAIPLVGLYPMALLARD